MISLIVPTRNREYTLRVVAESYYSVGLVDEVIFVVDASTDDTMSFLGELADRYPNVKTQILINKERLGASHNRMRGVRAASNPYVLFCDDDMFMTPNYGMVCLDKMTEYNAAAVSGRFFHRERGEPLGDAIRRFGSGLRRVRPFHPWTIFFNNEAVLDGDSVLPLTHACILTQREMVLKYGFDTHYDRGNGYREESDYQMNLFVNGHKIMVTNDAHTIHLHRTEVTTGGQRIGSRFKRIYWSVVYTGYFYGKYWNRYAKLMGIPFGRRTALAVFVVYQAYLVLVRPIRHFMPRSMGGTGQFLKRASA